VTGSGVVQALLSDTPDIADVVTKAFFATTLACRLVPDPAQRQDPLWGHLLLTIRHAQRHGHVDLTADRTAAAVWVHHDSNPQLPPPMPPDYDQRLADYCGPHIDMFRALDRLFESCHPGDTPHHYLAVIGVDPDCQRQGHGTSLLEHHHTVLDRKGLGAFLVATSSDAARLYESRGYRTTRELRLFDADPTMYAMWRDPATAATQGRHP
jgi:ribosomal protein S18 acetylase RimI-like enzyme